MTFHTFEIDFPKTHGRHGKVTMDGVELRGVTAVALSGEVDEAVKVTITFLPEKVIARVVDPKVLTVIEKLIAETTDMGATNKTFIAAEPVSRGA